MYVDVKIYKSNHIGGYGTLITITENDSSSPKIKEKILIDFGMALPGAKNIDKRLINFNEKTPTSIFFTHYHGDHMGRLVDIPNATNIKIYMSELAYNVTLNIHKFLLDHQKYIPQNHSLSTSKKIIQKLEKGKKDGSIIFIKNDDDIKLNLATVTSYEVDHSAMGAMMFLIKAGDTNILHTGDFRGHGHFGDIENEHSSYDALMNTIDNKILANGRKINTLIIEGTMVGQERATDTYTEKDLLTNATEYFKTHRHIFLNISSTNADALASYYHAAKVNNIPLYANKYVLRQLELFKKEGQKHGTSIYNFEATDLSSCNKAQMKEQGFLAIVNEYDASQSFMDTLNGVDFELIYSKWTGYLEENASYSNNKLIAFCKKYNAITCFNNDSASKKYTHTSGHAYPKLIAEIINRVHPSEQILPMHTENPEGFKALDICEDLKEKIIYSYELTPDEQKVLENYETKDQRHISDELKDEFTKGKLKEFLNFVRNHNDKIDRDKTKNDNDKLLILFRGNSNKISIYKYNHIIWDLTYNNDKSCKITFNFNHARYTENWKTLLEKRLIKKLGFEIGNSKASNDTLVDGYITPTSKKNNGTIGNISCVKKAEIFTYSFVEETYEIFSKLIINYFDNNAIDYFKKAVNTKYAKQIENSPESVKPTLLVEKRWQQRLYFHFKNMENDYYAYDLEFSQAYPNLIIRSKLEVNEPDMLAIRYKDGIPQALVLIEVKSTASACSGSSGIKEHMKGMFLYSKQKELIKHRMTDVKEILKQYNELGYISSKVDFDKAAAKIPHDIEIERILLLTNANVKNSISGDINSKRPSALSYLKDHRNSIKDLADKYKFEVFTVDENCNYWNDSLTIKKISF